MGVEIPVNPMSDQQEEQSRDEEQNGLSTFLSGDGAIGILVQLDADDGLINKELHDRIHVVSTTLSDRLSEARQLGLIEIVSDPRDHGNANRYQLTERGDALRRRLLSRGVDEIYDEFADLRAQLKSEANELETWALAEGIDDERWPGDRDRDDDRPET